MPELVDIVPKTLHIVADTAGGSWHAEYGLIAAGWEPGSPAASPPAVRRVIGFSQRDPRWAKMRLGVSNLTMGGAGCAVTSCAMLATLIEPELTPLDLVTRLNANGGFTGDGLLYWAKVAEAVPGLKFVKYHLWRKAPADLEAIARALANNPQIMQVDFTPATAELDTHFVLALDWAADGRDIDIIDPWTNTRTTLLAAYGAQGWTLERAIYAMAEYRIER